MSEALTELLFWIVIFVVFFFGFKWLQDRKKKARQEKTDNAAEQAAKSVSQSAEEADK